MSALTVRHLQVDLDTPWPRHWAGGCAFRSAFFNALSFSFPAGEQLFIDAVRMGVDRLDDAGRARFADEVRGFVGQEATRRLIPGQVLTTAHVAPPELVKRGQEVTLYAARPGLSVRMKGEALEDGAEGERIRVRNRSSKRIVEGYVEPSGAVRVAL